MSWAVIEDAVIELSGAAGDTVVVPGVTGKSICVLNYVMVSDGAVKIRFKSGTTNKSGPMPCTQFSGVSSPAGTITDGWLFACGVGEDLVINRDAGTAVSGHLAFFRK